ncbi:hypothetical protein SAMN05444920_103265 [Nonomuraea solani]|uniref:Uncharacterized protein n=1 Tax=Nonomuraea solani TaxID=1144553 RepID=A0A1H6BAL7_9ACTN|nr:hypothetical protein SAMN05444920_103265 [Nonomuraea solani]
MFWLQVWKLRPEQLLYPWQTDDPKEGRGSDHV